MVTSWYNKSRCGVSRVCRTSSTLAPLCNHFHSETTRQPPPHDKDWEFVKHRSHNRFGSPASKRSSSCRVSATWFLALLRFRLGGSARAKTNKESHFIAKLVWLSYFIPLNSPRLAAATAKTWSTSHAVPSPSNTSATISTKATAAT